MADLLCFLSQRELMMGDDGKPGKKMKLKGKMRKLDRPPENPVVDVSQLYCSVLRSAETIMRYVLTCPYGNPLSPFLADHEVRASA